MLTVAPERMKDGKAHRVPLSPAAVEVLRAAGPVRSTGLVFRSPTGKPLAGKALLEVVQAVAGPGVTTHGMRSSLRTWCGDQAIDRTLAEAALAHSAAQSAVEAAYSRSDLLDRRRLEVMVPWAAFVTGTGGQEA